MSEDSELIPGMIAEQAKKPGVDPLRRFSRINNSIIWVIVTIQTFLVVILSVAVGILVRQSLTEHDRFVSDIRTTNASVCRWNYDVANTTPPPEITKIGVIILIDSRVVVHDLGCKTLPPPTPKLLKLAHKYDLKVPY